MVWPIVRWPVRSRGPPGPVALSFVLAFLGPDWVQALDDAASASAVLAQRTADLDLVVEQHVSAVPGVPGGEVSYHVSFDHGAVSVRPGPAAAPTVRFSQDLDTAIAIAAGSSSAQRAFMTGRLRVGGDLTVLLAHGDVLAELDDVFAPVRERTELPAAAAPPSAAAALGATDA